MHGSKRWSYRAPARTYHQSGGSHVVSASSGYTGLGKPFQLSRSNTGEVKPAVSISRTHSGENHRSKPARK